MLTCARDTEQASYDRLMTYDFPFIIFHFSFPLRRSIDRFPARREDHLTGMLPKAGKAAR
jgi:hypothetical protein